GPLARLLLECSDGLDQVAIELLGVPPGELQVLSGDANLAGVAERPGHVRVCFSGELTRGPRAGEAVVRDATKEHRVGAAEGVADGGPHLVVEVGEVPVLRVLDDAVEGDEHACDDLLHADLSMLCGLPVLTETVRSRRLSCAFSTPARLLARVIP